MRISAAATLLVASMWLIAVALDADGSLVPILCGFAAGTAAYWGVVLIAKERGRGGSR